MPTLSGTKWKVTFTDNGMKIDQGWTFNSDSTISATTANGQGMSWTYAEKDGAFIAQAAGSISNSKLNTAISGQCQGNAGTGLYFTLARTVPVVSTVTMVKIV